MSAALASNCFRAWIFSQMSAAPRHRPPDPISRGSEALYRPGPCEAHLRLMNEGAHVRRRLQSTERGTSTGFASARRTVIDSKRTHEGSVYSDAILWPPVSAQNLC